MKYEFMQFIKGFRYESFTFNEHLIYETANFCVVAMTSLWVFAQGLWVFVKLCYFRFKIQKRESSQNEMVCTDQKRTVQTWTDLTWPDLLYVMWTWVTASVW